MATAPRPKHRAGASCVRRVSPGSPTLFLHGSRAPAHQTSPLTSEIRSAPSPDPVPGRGKGIRAAGPGHARHGPAKRS